MEHEMLGNWSETSGVLVVECQSTWVFPGSSLGEQKRVTRSEVYSKVDFSWAKLTLAGRNRKRKRKQHFLLGSTTLDRPQSSHLPFSNLPLHLDRIKISQCLAWPVTLHPPFLASVISFTNSCERRAARGQLSGSPDQNKLFLIRIT